MAFNLDEIKAALRATRGDVDEATELLASGGNNRSRGVKAGPPRRRKFQQRGFKTTASKMGQQELALRYIVLVYLIGPKPKSASQLAGIISPQARAIFGTSDYRGKKKLENAFSYWKAKLFEAYQYPKQSKARENAIKRFKKSLDDLGKGTIATIQATIAAAEAGTPLRPYGSRDPSISRSREKQKTEAELIAELDVSGDEGLFGDLEYDEDQPSATSFDVSEYDPEYEGGQPSATSFDVSEYDPEMQEEFRQQLRGARVQVPLRDLGQLGDDSALEEIDW
jgi:hypothetical protein